MRGRRAGRSHEEVGGAKGGVRGQKEREDKPTEEQMGQEEREEDTQEDKPVGAKDRTTYHEGEKPHVTTRIKKID